MSGASGPEKIVVNRNAVIHATIGGFIRSLIHETLHALQDHGFDLVYSNGQLKILPDSDPLVKSSGLAVAGPLVTFVGSIAYKLQNHEIGTSESQRRTSNELISDLLVIERFFDITPNSWGGVQMKLKKPKSMTEEKAWNAFFDWLELKQIDAFEKVPLTIADAGPMGPFRGPLQKAWKEGLLKSGKDLKSILEEENKNLSGRLEAHSKWLPIASQNKIKEILQGYFVVNRSAVSV